MVLVAALRLRTAKYAISTAMRMITTSALPAITKVLTMELPILENAVR